MTKNSSIKEEDFYLEEGQIERDLSINQNSLIEEFLEQPSRYSYYASLFADSKKDLDEAEEHEKVTRSKIIIELKELDPKMTIQVIEASYRTDDRHVKAVAKTIEAEHTHNILQGVLEAFRQRKSSLENVARLKYSEFNAEPKAPGYDKAALEESKSNDIKKRQLMRREKNNKGE